MSPKDEEDSDDIDLGIDAEDIANKGMEAGVKSGVRQGIKDGIKPFAQKAGEDAVKNIMSGGDPTDKTLDQINKMVKTQALQSYANVLQKQAQGNSNPPAQAPIADPAQSLLSTLNVLQSVGINPSQLTDKIGINTLLSLINPQLAPLMLMMQQNKPQPQQNTQQDQMLPLLMMLMQQNQNKPATPPPSSGNELIVAMMTQQAQLQQKLFEVQQQSAQFQQQALMESIKPYLNQSHPSFSDELAGLKDKVEAFKGLGLFGSTNPSSQHEAEFELRKTQMAMDLEREKMRMAHEDNVEDKRYAKKQQEQEQWNQIINTAGNFMKNLNLEQLLPKQTAQPEIQASSGGNITNLPTNQAPVQRAVPLSTEITQKINQMLRISSVKPTPQPEPEEEANEQTN